MPHLHLYGEFGLRRQRGLKRLGKRWMRSGHQLRSLRKGDFPLANTIEVQALRERALVKEAVLLEPDPATLNITTAEARVTQALREHYLQILEVNGLGTSK